MNSESSRSHLVMMMEISSTNKRTGHKVTGKLTLVDLAGSERATAINKSLSALGDVIASLTAAAGGHVPYRNHPLTMLMSDSVGGSAKTMMIVCSSPRPTTSRTLTSLQFATRCKDVRSSADPRAAAATIADLKAEVKKLREGGASVKVGGGHAVAPRGPAALGAKIRPKQT
ncbi:hypothetical protein JL720_14315 [Aureococcus anophagefferens]|nr:hypothetical protein JL720_14315 [Aureococcus anophagefferens]